MATVASVVSAYLRHLERQKNQGKYSADHLSNVQRTLGRFAKYIGAEKDCAECRQHDLSEWLATTAQGHAASTQTNACSAIIGCWRWAEEEDLIERCPYRRPRSLRGAISKPRRPATKEEYLKLRRGGSRSLRAALYFLYETGARTCEMREALWTDITIEARPVIALYVHKTARKTGRCRIVALNDAVLRVLMLMKRKSESCHIFVNSHGGPWDRHTFATHLRRAARRLGMDEGIVERVSGYCLRHSYACAALTAGFTSKEVADQLGHSDSRMVERVYGSHTKGDVSYLNRIADDIRRRRA